MSEESELAIIAACFSRLLGDLRASNRALIKAIKNTVNIVKPVVKKPKSK